MHKILLTKIKSLKKTLRRELLLLRQNNGIKEFKRSFTEGKNEKAIHCLEGILTNASLVHSFEDRMKQKVEYSGAINLVRHLLSEELNHEKKIRFLQDVAKKQPENMAIIILLVEFLVENDDFPAALHHLKDILATVDDNYLLVQDLYIKATRHGKSGLVGNTHEVHDDDFRGRFCPRPFSHLDIHPAGDVYCCTPGLLQVSIGNIYTHSWKEIWNSEKVRCIRDSILQGSFQYCSKLFCPNLKFHCLPRSREVTDPVYLKYIKNNQTELDHGPRFINLSHDTTCNLSCPSCIAHISQAGDDLNEKHRFLLDEALPSLLQKAETLRVSANGDPFASRHYQDIISMLDVQMYPNLNLHILTNGLLFNERQWNRMKNIHTMLEKVIISVDAATVDTYRKVRPGGKFNVLLENIDFIDSLKRVGKFREFQLNFLVQACNFKEMMDFAAMSRKWQVTMINFQIIRNWGSYSKEDFKEVDIFNEDHPDHNDFLKIMEDPFFQNSHHTNNTFNDLGNEFLRVVCPNPNT